MLEFWCPALAILAGVIALLALSTAEKADMKRRIRELEKKQEEADAR